VGQIRTSVYTVKTGRLRDFGDYEVRGIWYEIPPRADSLGISVRPLNSRPVPETASAAKRSSSWKGKLHIEFYFLVNRFACQEIGRVDPLPHRIDGSLLQHGGTGKNP